jgi:hypothetical protein
VVEGREREEFATTISVQSDLECSAKSGTGVEETFGSDIGLELRMGWGEQVWPLLRQAHDMAFAS